MPPFPLGVVTDEMDQDLEHACRVAVELGMQVVELNTLWGKPSDRLEPDEVRRVRAIVARHGLRIAAISIAAFKALELSRHPDLRRSVEFGEHMAMLRRAVGITRSLDGLMVSPAVRIFSFRREPMQGLGNPSPILPDGGGLPEAMLARIAEGLRPACDLARDEGVQLLVENVRSCWGNTGANTARILRAIDRPELGAIWDVANDFVSRGGSYHEGYAALRPFAHRVHCKDARILDPASGLTAWTPIGAGAVNTAGQMADLLRDAFAGPLLLETHWRGDGLTAEASSRRSFAGLRAAITQSQATLA